MIGATTSDRTTAAATAAGCLGSVARSSCMPSTSSITGIAASLRRSNRPHDRLRHRGARGQHDDRRRDGIDRRHLEQASPARRHAAAAARRHEDADGVDQDGARHEVDAGERQRFFAERKQHDGQRVVAAVGEHRDKQEGAERRPVEPQRQRRQSRGDADGERQQHAESGDAQRLRPADCAVTS